MHSNSIEAYHELSDYLTGRRGEVYQWLKANGQATDRQIKEGLGYEDMNQVRPRVTELIEQDLIEECAQEIDGKTNRKVRVVRVVK